MPDLSSDRPAAQDDTPALQPANAAGAREYDLSSPAFIANPYPTYERLLAESPEYWDEATHTWYIARHHRVACLFRDPRLSSNRLEPMLRSLAATGRQALRPLLDILSPWLIYLDPPAHTPIRKAMTKALTLRLITAMAPHIQALADHLIAAIYAQGQLDLIQDLAYPLPAIVIAEMLGAPPADRDHFKRWSDAIARFLGARTPLEEALQIQQSVLELHDYCRHLIARQRAAPAANLMSSLLALQHQDPQLTDDTLAAHCLSLIFAGHETTTYLIANGLLALFNHPAQGEALRREPALITTAVDECLRYDSPVQRLGRIALEEIVLDNGRIQPQQRLLLLIGAANRDPQVFPHPTRFDIRRVENPHLSFGYGIHFCAGAALGRLEAQIAMTTVLQRLKGLTLALDTLCWHDNLGLRALKALPATFIP